MCSSRTKAALALAAALAAAMLSGCIADTAEDNDLPWASNKNWEGMGPVPASFIDHYD